MHPHLPASMHPHPHLPASMHPHPHLPASMHPHPHPLPLLPGGSPVQWHQRARWFL
jgi:hypothetical protein